MTTIVLALVLAAQTTPGITRDAYGIPTVKAATRPEVFRLMGRAVAEDRLWQMENSRRLARGQMAEVFGKARAAADTETLKTGYTDEEMQLQIDQLSAPARAAFQSYSDGVNDAIAAMKARNALPDGYAKNGFEPRPWVPLDSAAIAISMARLFGGGGQGELRNWLAYQYLLSQPAKTKALDVLDDLMWQNDPTSVPTVAPADDPLAKDHPSFPNPTRAETEKILADLPKTPLFELLPTLRLSAREETTRVALAEGLPYKWGSYAVVVGKDRSKTGRPYLLNGPQMGHSMPSIVHEVVIDCPGYRVAGMNVPGVPGIPVGYTDRLAWGLTTAVNDTQDVYYSHQPNADSYRYGDQILPIQRFSRTLKVKGEPDQTVTTARTRFGVVLLESKAGQAVYSLRSAIAGKELAGFEAIFDVPSVNSWPKIRDQVLPRIALGFNFFCATSEGDAAWWYCGATPKRPEGIDPRFPIAGKPQNEWRGTIPFAQMPHVENPKSGLIANWNNKPASWWPNMDTPAWGAIFRNASLLASLPSGKIGADDLQDAIRAISRRDSGEWSAIGPYFVRALRGAKLDERQARAARYLLAYNGELTTGNQGARIFGAALGELRKMLFLDVTGNFLDPNTFATAVQPSVIYHALRRETKHDYLGKRRPEDACLAAFGAACEALTKSSGPDPELWQYEAGGIRYGSEPLVPYGNRGTYIQILELANRPTGWNVFGPGVAESGPHSLDLAPLVRSWGFKRTASW